MVILKTLKQIDKIRKSCVLAAYVLSKIKHETKAGVTPLYLNNLAESLCLDMGCCPGVKNYEGYPYTLCCSKNNIVVHGFPDEVPLKNGDIISFDIGINCNGWWGDMAITIPIGKVSKEAKKLISVTKDCLQMGMHLSLVGNRIGDISHIIQTTCELNGMTVVKDFVGHGVGRDLHEPPQIPNFGTKGEGIKLKAGMVLAIEPIICNGSGEVTTLKDGWNVVTKDNSLAAHFENTILITSNGYEILTSLD